MAHCQLAEPPADHAVDIARGSQVRQEHFILGLHGGPIGAVHVGIVEVVAIDAPRFFEDLLPFGTGFDSHFDSIEVQPSAAFGISSAFSGSAATAPRATTGAAAT